MTYTIIGCGAFYNQPREKTWCLLTQTDVSVYHPPILENPDSAIDFTNIDGLAAILARTLRRPDLSENWTSTLCRTDSATPPSRHCWRNTLERRS